MGFTECEWKRWFGLRQTFRDDGKDDNSGRNKGDKPPLPIQRIEHKCTHLAFHYWRVQLEGKERKFLLLENLVLLTRKVVILLVHTIHPGSFSTLIGMRCSEGRLDRFKERRH